MEEIWGRFLKSDGLDTTEQVGLTDFDRMALSGVLARSHEDRVDLLPKWQISFYHRTFPSHATRTEAVIFSIAGTRNSTNNFRKFDAILDKSESRPMIRVHLACI